MRIRSVKPEFYRDDVTGLMECEVALFYLALCGFADDAGCFEWNARLIRADVDPYDAKWGGPKGIERQLGNLEQLGRIARYSVDGRAYGRILSFRSHQSPKKPAYRCPQPSEDSGSEPVRNLFGTSSEAVPSGSGEGSGEGSGSGGGECAELNSAPAVVSLPCVGEGPKEYAVTDTELTRWRDAYPGLDALSEARRMLLWLDANPTRRKTHRGMPRFISNWLGRSQDRGSTGPPKPPVTQPASPAEKFKKGGQIAI